MRDLIVRQLYHPAVVLPMVALMQLMVSQDFNLAQVGVMAVTRGAQAALHSARSLFCHGHCTA
ncbi:hypothetical protein [Paraburkholderia megapolitana]|uniref:Uncharacterized protein n=1 Tax=Paraburkholderia megapolitana TaxID=420953 RepID=A0A1I3NT62_9BURK|nr:hypothetical protein [Paraburkholderia megapolitana]QDQ84486.1 hypothetical protein FNZ07_25700 [Paraburkholderia megapolitana]SFJ12170.1 hypothetical protein SAMN05192543_105501 [Paraburkholderia megapolitana]